MTGRHGDRFIALPIESRFRAAHDLDFDLDPGIGADMVASDMPDDADEAMEA